MYIYIPVHHSHVVLAEAGRGHQIPGNCSYRQLLSTMWTLGIKLGSFERTPVLFLTPELWLQSLTLSPYHIFILIAFFINLSSVGVTVLNGELHHTAECACHCGEEGLDEDKLLHSHNDMSCPSGSVRNS